MVPRRLFSRVPTVVVLAALAGVGWWGAVCDWKPSRMLPGLFREPSAEKKKPAEEPDNPASSPGAIVLDSEQSGERAGLDSDAARREAVALFVEAPAVLAFDQTRYAHLSPRAAGTAYRVSHSAGDAVKVGDVLALVASREVSKAKADFLSAMVQYEIKDRTLARAQAASGSLPERQLRDAQLAVRESRVQLVNAQQALLSLGLPLKLSEVHGQPDDAVAAKLRGLGLPAAMTGGEDAPANLLPLAAPIDGLVIRRDLVVGEAAGPDKVAFVVANVGRLWLQMDVRLEDIDRLALGQSVTFEGATGQLAEGSLKWVSAEVDPKTRTVKARAEVYNLAGRLRPGTFGKARVVVQSNGGVTVPTGAIQWDGHGPRVFVRRDGRTFEPRLALPGASAAGRTELLDPRLLLAAGLAGSPLTALTWVPAAGGALVPVAPGEKVVTTGSHVLKSEMLKSRIGGDD